MKIAVVEDDEQIALLITLILKEISENIIIINNGWKAINLNFKFNFAGSLNYFLSYFYSFN